jgi:D-cysteine desulfhydrase
LAEGLPHVALAALPTPVEALDVGAEGGGSRLYVKRDDLSGTVYGGNKVRKLEFLLGDALKRKAREVVTFGFAGSNHTLATAIYARQLGLKSTSVLMPQANAHYVRRNLLAGCRCGTRFLHYGNLLGLLFGVGRLRLCEKMKHGVAPVFIPAGGSCPLGVTGYVNAALELRDQVAAGELPEPALIYVALGSMGTAAGLMLGLAAAGLKSRVVPVRTIEERLASPGRMRRLMRGTISLLRRMDPSFPHVPAPGPDLEIRNDCLGEGYARFTPEAVRARALVRERAGIELNGTYSAKAFAALLADARNGKLDGKTVLFWNTYNSRALSPFTDGVDYHRLPKPFHRYFEEDVQPLDRETCGHDSVPCDLEPVRKGPLEGEAC